MRRTHAQLAELLRHEHASLALAQRCSGVAAPAPLFTALLNYRHSGRAGAAPRRGAPRRRWRGMRASAAEERTNYPLTLSVDDLGEGFRLTAQVTRRRSEPARVCALMHAALEALVEALETDAASAPWQRRRAAGGGARAGAWRSGTRRTAAYPRESCVHELFEEQVGAHARRGGAWCTRAEQLTLRRS